jgi:hypothetical protein
MAAVSAGDLDLQNGLRHSVRLFDAAYAHGMDTRLSGVERGDEVRPAEQIPRSADGPVRRCVVSGCLARQLDRKRRLVMRRPGLRWLLRRSRSESPARPT